jgi:tripartite-type tricarboxylate transporter receptor subunit TctC
MAHDIMMKGLVATYLASTQGQEMINRYLSSAEGQVSIRDYLATPDGKQTALMILPLVLDVVDLQEDVKNSVRTTMGRKS